MVPFWWVHQPQAGPVVWRAVVVAPAVPLLSVLVQLDVLFLEPAVEGHLALNGLVSITPEVDNHRHAVGALPHCPLRQV